MNALCRKYGDALLMKQPVEQPFTRHRGIDKFMILNRREEGLRLDPGVIDRPFRWPEPIWSIARIKIGLDPALRRARQKLRHDTACPPGSTRTRDTLRNRQTYPRWNLGRLVEILPCGVFQTLPLQSNDSLIAGCVIAIFDRDRQMALAKEIPCPRARADPFFIKPGERT